MSKRKTPLKPDGSIITCKQGQRFIKEFGQSKEENSLEIVKILHVIEYLKERLEGKYI